MYKNAYQCVTLVLSFNSQAPGVKNIYFTNEIIPCSIIITNLAQGIILLFKEIFLTSGACDLIILKICFCHSTLQCKPTCTLIL